MANRKYKNAVQERKARSRWESRYRRKAMKMFSFKFHKEHDKAVIDALMSKDNKNDYVRSLILKDIEKEER